VLTSQTFVPSGITLAIQAGVTIYASPVAADGGGAPALIIEKGGRILALGTSIAPITFTAFNPTVSSSSSVSTDSTSADTVLETRGKWGGLILLGIAPTNVPTTTQIEGITAKTYGGTNPTDTSGSLQYVRVWHGGAIVGANNEINGITFGGVGSGTVVDHCEVAFNVDDGFEFFGGTVNVKYLSVLFMGDDGFDVDQGYIGKGQFLIVIEGLSGDHSMEIDSGIGSNVTPRSHPAFYSFTLIGGGTGTGARTGELIHVNDGTGGKFGNDILAHPNLNGLLFEDCGSTLSYTQTLPAASVSISNPGYFYFSANNIIDTATTASQFALLAGGSGVAACTPADTWTAVIGAPGFVAVNAASAIATAAINTAALTATIAATTITSAAITTTTFSTTAIASSAIATATFATADLTAPLSSTAAAAAAQRAAASESCASGAFAASSISAATIASSAIAIATATVATAALAAALTTTAFAASITTASITTTLATTSEPTAITASPEPTLAASAAFATAVYATLSSTTIAAAGPSPPPPSPPPPSPPPPSRPPLPTIAAVASTVAAVASTVAAAVGPALDAVACKVGF
jgi:hypothetical protein